MFITTYADSEPCNISLWHTFPTNIVFFSLDFAAQSMDVDRYQSYVMSLLGEGRFPNRVSKLLHIRGVYAQQGFLIGTLFKWRSL